MKKNILTAQREAGAWARSGTLSWAGDHRGRRGRDRGAGGAGTTEWGVARDGGSEGAGTTEWGVARDGGSGGAGTTEYALWFVKHRKVPVLPVDAIRAGVTPRGEHCLLP